MLELLSKLRLFAKGVQLVNLESNKIVYIYNIFEYRTVAYSTNIKLILFSNTKLIVFEYLIVRKWDFCCCFCSTWLGWQIIRVCELLESTND